MPQLTFVSYMELAANDCTGPHVCSGSCLLLKILMLGYTKDP